MDVRAEHYRAAALERLEEARLLYEERRYGGATYYAGVAAESMIRAFLPMASRSTGVMIFRGLLGPISGSDRISGVLTWAGFAGKDFTERQKVVWDALRNNFRENSIRISTIVTLTPEELRDYSAGS